MNEIEIFKHEKFGEIRTITENGKTLFCGSDVAKALGYAKPRNAVARHCKGALKRGILTEGGEQEMTVIPEGDIYRLAAKSELPGADEFESWIFDDVLPTIRKYGMYATPVTIDAIISDPDFGIRILSDLKAERERNKALELKNAQSQQIIGELKPKADYTDIILKNKGLVTITQIAKDYGMSGRALNSLLHRYGVQYKQSGQWLLYAKYHGCGYTHSDTIPIAHSDGTESVKMETKWTQKGRLFIYELLKGKGILPLIERKEESA